jgi:hypothetical protein
MPASLYIEVFQAAYSSVFATIGTWQTEDLVYDVPMLIGVLFQVGYPCRVSKHRVNDAPIIFVCNVDVRCSEDVIGFNSKLAFIQLVVCLLKK